MTFVTSKGHIIDLRPMEGDRDRYHIWVNGKQFGLPVYGSDGHAILYWLERNLDQLLDTLTLS